VRFKLKNGPLSGTKVLDLSQVLTGPYCTQILGDLGADVIKVEPPGGDGTRKWGPPFIGGESAYFLSVNRNKRSIVIDLKAGNDARRILRRIAKKADVMIENFRPGVASELGIPYRLMKRINPRLIYCSISGYGQTGPLKHKPGYDIAAFAASGIMSITGEKNSSPMKVGVPVADIGAGMFAAIGIVSSLYERQNMNGMGRYIDISMFDSMLSWLTFQAGSYFATGENPIPLGSAHPIIAPYQAFKAKDRFFILAIGNDNQWKRACQAIDSEDLAKDGRFETNSKRRTNREDLVHILEKRLSKQKADYWLRKFEFAGVPCSPINSVSEALESPQARARKMVLKLHHPTAGDFRSISSPIDFTGFRSSEKDNLPPPTIGQQSRSILREFDYTASDIEDLFERKIVA